MSLTDFVSGSNSLPRLLAEEKLMEVEVALSGGMVDERYIKSVIEKYNMMTKSTKEIEQLKKLEAVRAKWTERGVKVS